MKRTILYITFILLFFPFVASHADSSFRVSDLKWAKDVGARKQPAGTKVYKVSDYGAKPDGKTLNTKAIQNAIDVCAKNGGGIVTFDKGKYLTGSVYLKEGVNLVVPKGVTLLGSTNIADYPDIDTRVAGIEMRWPSALINVLNEKNVMISGDGIVHAQGKVFWDKYWAMRKDYESKGLRWIVDYDCKRPRTVLVSESADVTVKDITFQQAGFWTIQLLYSTYCTVDGVVVQNNLGGHGPSTDGVDVDSSSRILIENCDIDCNDDNFCLKAGRDADGLRVNRPTEYVVIRNCISRAGGGLITCGSETSGGIRYVLAHGLKAMGTTVGIRLKSAMNRGGTTEHIYIKDIEMDNVETAFEATMNWHPAYSYSALPKEYEGRELPEHWTKMLEKVDTDQGMPYFNDVYLSDINIKHATRFLNVEGSKKSVMKNFHLANIKVNAESAGKVAFAADWSMSNVNIRSKDNSKINISDSRNVSQPENAMPATKFAYELNGVNATSKIMAADYPEFGFCLPEMAGNVRFGVIVNGKSKWVKDFEKKNVKYDNNQLVYSISDPLLKKGELTFKVISLSKTDGVVIEVDNENIPDGLQLFWAYGGASGQALSKSETPSLMPEYCLYNIFSVEHTAFTVYYGESMRLRVLQGVTPASSDIRLSDAYEQYLPLTFFGSGKDTNAPALAATVPLNKKEKEYFCFYKQNQNADYSYYMLGSLFDEEQTVKYTMK
ncbi:DUF4450 domain-containing protein [Dysgonomonas sp. 216]|uniref:DUF4450 domain-containing protein n=1 Tax=Dysgonomonas sp. 216 TaxID=2302934 RepID=UPI0013D888A1|nr:DUF4450 domain-containing protein [Dysgonomonas sp. 216]